MSLNFQHNFSKTGFAVAMLFCASAIAFKPLSAQQFINNGASSFVETSKEGLPPGWEYQNNTGNPHGIIVVLEANPRINEIPIKFGDYIGAFYEDDFGELKCGGADFWDGMDNIIFAAFGDDPDTPEKDGFGYAETMHFKVYYQDNQKAYDVSGITWDPTYYGTDKWSPLGISSALDMFCEVEFDAYATVSDNPVCAGETVELAANIFIPTTGNYTYLWTSDPPGLNSSTATTTHTPSGTTTYILEVSDGTNTSIHELPVVVHHDPEIFSGTDQTICEDQHVQLDAQAQNHSGILWTTTGDGTFVNPGSLQTIYYPGIQDKEIGASTLTVTAFPNAPCTIEAYDSITITLHPASEISLPAALEFCELAEMYIEAEAINYSSVLWTTFGDGTFSDPELLVTRYFPGSSDLANNEFSLEVFANSIAPCQTVSSAEVFISTFDPPVLNVPSTRTACENSPVNVNGIAFNYTASLWSSDGDGTFGNPEALSTQYFPGAQDKATGGTTLQLAAFGTGICQEYAVSKNVQVILISLPVADAGEDTEICQDGMVQLSGSAENYTYVSWSGNGDGFFDNIYSLTPNYYPGNQDINSGSFSLYLTANAIYPCNLPATDTIEIEVLPEPEVTTGIGSATICFGDNYHFTDASATSYSSLAWFTINGSGTFDNNAILHPTYYPDPEHDYSLGSIIIGVTAQPVEPCTAADDAFMTLIMIGNPEVEAGEDATIIQGETFVAQPVIENYSTVEWTSSGDGTFDSPFALNPEYHPGETDVLNNTATLSVVAMPAGTCTISDSDSLVLTILNRQNILLSGGEQSFSTYIDLQGKTFEEVIAPVAGRVVFAQNFLQVYWTEYNINTFENFSELPACRIVMNSGDSLNITGYRTTEKTIAFADGWNILPVLSSCNVDVQHIIDQLGLSLIMITEFDGDQIVYPAGQVFTLGELVPGKSYMIKVSGNTVFTFPDCSK
jgi:hypothetical protein